MINPPPCRSAHLVLRKSQGTGQITTVDLADNPPFQSQPLASDHPDLPFPNDSSTISSAGDPAASPSPELRPTANQPPSSVATHIRNPLRRHLSSSPETSVPLTAGNGISPEDAGETLSQNDSSSNRPSRADGRPPSRKRRRLAIMRPDGLSANGFSQASSNGSVSTPTKASLNGRSTTSANGDSHENGTGKAPASSTYYGHNREEVTRILIQSLHDLGYGGAASMLSAESGYELETVGVATFRSAVLGGRWSEAERILIQSFKNASTNNQKAPPEETLVLAENAERNEMLFYLRQQKFLELLEARDVASALTVLRQELTPLNYDIDRLHALSRLVILWARSEITLTDYLILPQSPDVPARTSA